MTMHSEHGQASVKPPGPAASRATVAPVVEMRDIRVSFGGVHAVEGVSVDVRPGEVVGLVGGNGAGKSTLMRVLSGAQKADSGEILVDGKPISISNPRDAKALGIECIYQTLALADNIDAAGNVFLGRELRTRLGSLDDAAMESATRQVLGRLNPRFRNFKTAVKSLSGGQRQSIAIARAASFKPRVLIMDEPTSALAVAEVEAVLALITRVKASGVAVVLITHRLQDLFRVCDRIAVMYEGLKVAERRIGDTNLEDLVRLIVGEGHHS
jgi:ABC-type sugar transport system ATPase subunit